MTDFNLDEKQKALTTDRITINKVVYTRKLRTVDLDNQLRQLSHDLNDAIDAENQILGAETLDREKASAASEKVREIQFAMVAAGLEGAKGADVDPKIIRAAVDTRMLNQLQRFLDQPSPDPS